MQKSLSSLRFARRVSRRAWTPLRQAGDVVFVEDAFEIFEGGERKDFRQMIDNLIGGADRCWYPNDPHARYLPSGAMVSADETEALLAIAPMRMRRGIASAVADEVLARRAELAALLRRHNEDSPERADAEMHGYATAIAAFVPPERAPQVAARFARTAAPAAMLLLDLASSPGILVRANGRRIELVGDHVAARDDLRAAITFFLGATLAIEQGLALPELSGAIEPEPENGGFMVDRRAFGDDVYVAGRMASLKLVGGATILAGSLLGEIWTLARPLVAAFSTEDELALVDELVAGSLPLPLERDPQPASATVPFTPVQDFATIVRERRRGEILVRPAAVTWEAATLAITTPARTVFARIPLEQFASFAKAFERGSLDKPLAAFAAAQSRGRVATLDDTTTGLYDLAEIPQRDAENRPVRTGADAPIEKPKPARTKTQSAARAGRRFVTYTTAAAMFAGTAAFAFIGLRQSEPTVIRGTEHALIRHHPSPSSSVLANKQIATPKPANVALPTPAKATPSGATPQPVRPPTSRNGGSTSSPSRFDSPPTPQDAPTPEHPRPTHTQQPQPTSTPGPTHTPQPTHTPEPTHTAQPTPPPNTSSSPPAISGSTSCGVRVSYFSFTISTDSGAPKLSRILVQYAGSQVQPSPPPSYPADGYQGSASSPTSLNTNHRWTVSVQDQSGRPPVTRSFTDKCS